MLPETLVILVEPQGTEDALVMDVRPLSMEPQSSKGGSSGWAPGSQIEVGVGPVLALPVTCQASSSGV